jgi:hypothetical protein
MRDCGVGATLRMADPLPVQSPGNIQGVLDLLSNGLDITAPVRFTLGRPTPRLPSNENRSASWAIGQPLGICAANTVWQHHEYTGWK